MKKKKNPTAIKLGGGGKVLMAMPLRKEYFLRDKKPLKIKLNFVCHFGTLYPRVPLI